MKDVKLERALFFPFSDPIHSRTQSPSYARSTERDEGLWPNPYQTGIWLATRKVIVPIPDIFYYHVFYGIRLWIWPEPLVAPRVRRALGTRMDPIIPLALLLEIGCSRFSHWCEAISCTTRSYHRMAAASNNGAKNNSISRLELISELDSFN
jgi:hypothetical protein